ncbi:MAG: heavy metal-binding domain-containing protein [Verrucomicrobiota bacterium]
MKKLIALLSITTLATFTFATPLIASDGCCSGGENAIQAAPTAKQAAEQAQQYTCPMHAEVVSNKPGKCPKCGMNLVPVKDAAKSKM